MHITLSQFTNSIGDAIRTSPQTHNRWVAAELSDVAFRGIHCYMELIEKDDRGQTIAKMRANIWANSLRPIRAKFFQATSRELQSGLKVLLLGTATMHPQFGLSMNVTDIDPSYTLGDAERLRREILAQLGKEGVSECNKQLEMPMLPQRIAVISSQTAAGYGDFMNQLHSNTFGYKFYTCLFEATMQGQNVGSSVSEALHRIEECIDLWDCVVIIRGGGATSDLEGFDNLELARNIATFVLPVVVGIGHERDRTVLDEIANTRVKTPTAAAEWLINRAHEADLNMAGLVNNILKTVQESVVGAGRQLDHFTSMLPLVVSKQVADKRNSIIALSSVLPMAITGRVEQNRRRLAQAVQAVGTSGAKVISEAGARLEMLRAYLKSSVPMVLKQRNMHLKSYYELLQALSPEQTLKRGYSITRVDGKAVTNASKIAPGTEIETTLAEGVLKSITE